MPLQLLAIARVASLLDLAKLTVIHWAYGHRPPPVGFPKPIKVGRQLRYIEDEILSWVKQQRGGITPSDPLLTAGSTPKEKRGRGRPTNAERAARLKER